MGRAFQPTTESMDVVTLCIDVLMEEWTTLRIARAAYAQALERSRSTAGTPWTEEIGAERQLADEYSSSTRDTYLAAILRAKDAYAELKTAYRVLLQNKAL